MSSQITDERKQEIFVYLDDLRESGETNMFGSPLYVQEEFGMSPESASHIVGRWMKTFSERHPQGKE